MKKISKTALVIVFCVMVLSMVANAREQKGENPYVLHPERETDNLEMLTAASAECPDGISVFNAGIPKYFWVDNFGVRSDDYLRWYIQSDLSQLSDYHVRLHISANQGTTFQITVKQGGFQSRATYVKSMDGWEVAEVGTVEIPAGVSEIKLEKVSRGHQMCSVKALELILESDRAAFQDRISEYRHSGVQIKTAFSNLDYGLFFQYGSWGYPQTGDKKGFQEATNDFDVEKFMALLKKTETKFIIWSITWKEYRMQMPNGSLDDIMGHSDFTTERNLIGEIAKRCHEEGIEFFLYYHQGMQEEKTWKDKQNWPDNDFTDYGIGDRSTFFDNWERVVGEVGTKLGTELDGWFFDDGCVYYPAPFERLAKAAKQGNDNRIIAYNSWVGTKITEFADMTFGEGSWGETQDTTEGILNSGREEGLLQVAQPMLNNGDWGVSTRDESISLAASPEKIIEKVKSAHERNVPMALNIKMWEGGVIGDTTLDALLKLTDAMHGIEDQDEIWINDDHPGIKYGDNQGWCSRGKIYKGYYQTDCHKSTDLSRKPTVEYTFEGTNWRHWQFVILVSEL